ncbi:MAG: choice-of-anchor J domain-containing protein [Fimbriimonadales bacterium]
MNRILIAAVVVGASSSAFAQISEGFDDINLLGGAGWNLVNLSVPVGTQPNWFQGNDTVFPAQSGALPTSYMAANFNFVAGAGDITAWAMTPEITLQNGAMWSFWARSIDSAFPDRLHFKMSTNGGSTNAGDFTTTLVTINPNLVQGVFVDNWTEYTGMISGLGGATQGRLAFHYDVPNSGPSGINGDYIGVDTFDYNPVPEPGTIAVIALGLGALIARRRKA